MVTVFVDKITARIEYTFDFIFKSRGIDYSLVLNIDEFNQASIPKLNYSAFNTEESTINSCGILLEEGIRTLEISKGKFNSIECLTFDAVQDPIASIFYVLTRYEEYTCQSKDEHDRFPAKESILIKYSWIEQCVCDRWALEILRIIEVENLIVESDSKLIPTFDIDNTYAYKLKTGKVKILSICKDILTFNFARLMERRAVNKGEKDPYDTFDVIREIGAKHMDMKLFWLIGERSEKDRNISIENLEHQQLITSLDRDFEVNLHPSYNSNGVAQIIKKEKISLQYVLDRVVIRSRQHYLRFELPRTFNSLISAGFQHEYSMGFAERVGFRSGTARSHFWFNLETNEITKLKIHPFAYMDGTLNEYMNLSISESKQKIKDLFTEVSTFGGDFIFIWHNETIGDYNKWKGWSEVLHYTLSLKDE